MLDTVHMTREMNPQSRRFTRSYNTSLRWPTLEEMLIRPRPQAPPFRFERNGGVRLPQVLNILGIADATDYANGRSVRKESVEMRLILGDRRMVLSAFGPLTAWVSSS